MTEKFIQFVIRNNKRVIAFAILLVVIAASGAAKLGVTNEYKAFFSDQNPQLLAFDKLEKTYTPSDNVLIMVEPKSGDVFEPSTLQAILDITDEAWEIPFVRRVDSISNFQHSYSADDDLIIEDLYSSVDGLDIEKLRATALGEPLLLGRLISPSSDATAINLTLRLKSEFDTPVIIKAVATMLEDMQLRYPDLEFYESGVLPLNNALGMAVFNDMLTIVPFVFLAVVLGAAFYLRSTYLLVTSVILVTLSIVTAMGIAGWMGITLTPPSTSVPPIIMTLAVADCIHILMTFQQRRRAGLEQNEAIVESIDLNLMPVFITSITTAAGFLTLNFSDAPPFRDLGNMTAIGVIVAFFLSVTFLPAMLSLRPVKAPTHKPFLSDLMGSLADFVIAKSKIILIVGLVIAGALTALVPRNELNDNFVEYFDNTIKFRSDSDKITEKLTGVYFVEYGLSAGVTDGVTEPDYLRKVEGFQEWLNEQPEVLHVNSIVEIIKKLNYNLNNDDKDFYKIPDTKEAIAQFLLLFEMSLPNGLDLNSQVNVNKSATRITISLKTLSSSEMIEFEKRAGGWLEQNAPTLRSEGVSPSMMFSQISVRNIQSMLMGTAIALVFISIFMIVPLRSARHGLLSLVSNLLPACIAFGIWSMTVGKISMGVSVVIAMTLGIVVDDTIHLISKYLRSRREMGLSPEDAIRYSFKTVGVALVATTVALTLGFCVLATSSFQVNAHLSAVSAIIIVAALIVDLFIIPPLLLWMDKDKDEAVAPSAKLRPVPVSET